MDLSRFENDQLEVHECGIRTIKFDVYCDLLRKNDPRITEIRSCDYQNPRNGKPYHGIGQALQGNNNTHITAIEVTLGELYTLEKEIDEEYWCYDYLDSDEVQDLVEEGAESADCLLRYIRSCSSLRALQLSCNHQEWNLVNGRLAGMLYQAILDNPRSSLEELQVDTWDGIDIPQDEFTQLLATQPLKRLTLRAGVSQTRDILEDLETNSWSFTAPWLNEALQSCASLEYLSLLDLETYGGSVRVEGLFESVISRLGSHPCLRELRVQLVDSASEDVAAAALAQLLTLTGSLETLYLCGVLFSTVGMKHFVAGLQSNNTLTKLLLKGRFPSEPHEFSGYLHSSVALPSRYRENNGYYSMDSVHVRGKDLLMSYGQRNRSIPILLSEPEGNVEGGVNATEGWLFPTLFSVAQQAKRTAPNMMLIGLRTLAGSVGPCQRTKRLQS
jgi:hypothetical protein